MRIGWFLAGFACLVACGEALGSERPLDSFVTIGDAALLPLANSANDASEGHCLGVGNYHQGVCCPGLQQITQRALVFSDDGTAICSDGPLHPIACIEGSCGDGICEAPEAVACGCELDCPIATP